MGDISIKGRSPLLKGGRVGYSSAGPVKAGGISRLTGDTGGVKEIFPGMGISGGASRGKALLKNFKKNIKKTPNKQISKSQKKKIIQEQTMKKRKYEATGDKWSPLDYGAKAKGGKV
jgi:hypothetical protein